jgi:hypothetical protein
MGRGLGPLTRFSHSDCCNSNAPRQSAGFPTLAKTFPPESPSYLGVSPCLSPIWFIYGVNGVIQPRHGAAKMHHPGRIAVHLYRKIRKLSRTRGCSVSVTAVCILIGPSIMSGVLIAEGCELFIFSSAVAAASRINWSRFDSVIASIFQARCRQRFCASCLFSWQSSPSSRRFLQGG